MNGAFYNTRENFRHSSIVSVRNYCGPPVTTVIFVVTEATSFQDTKIASSYAMQELKLYFTHGTNYASLKKHYFPHTSDLYNKLVKP